MQFHPQAVRHAVQPQTVACPQCGAPAVIEARASLASTAGPLDHVKVRCLDRHWFLMPEELLGGA